jgi:iron complex outermembrane receptor protein
MPSRSLSFTHVLTVQRAISSDFVRGSILLIGSLTTAFPILAQQVQNTSGSPELAEIVVTALKRQQSILDVPASITVIQGDQLEKMDAVRFEDFARAIPGLSFEEAGIGQNHLTLRGIPNLGGSAPTVSFYVDDVPLTTTDDRTSASNPLAIDIDRIEVLRGPQGTLYGSSSMGGTIRIVTKQPDASAFSARVSADYSRTANTANNYMLQGMVNLPLFADSIALRITAVDGENGGYIKRIADPLVLSTPSIPPAERAAVAAGQSDINTERLKSVRAQLQVKLSDNVTLTPAIYYQSISEANQPIVDTTPNGVYQGLVSQQPGQEPRSDEFLIRSLTANINLGWGSIVSETSYDTREYKNNTDYTDFLLEIFGAGLPSTFKTGTKVSIFSQETRLVTDVHDSKWSSITGTYYNDLKDDAFGSLVTPGFSAAAGLPPGVVPNDNFFSLAAQLNIREFALFEELSYKITPRLTGTLGIRWFTSNTQFTKNNTGLFAGGTDLTTGFSDNNGSTPKAQLSYKISDDKLVYLTAAKGYRNGGANFVVPTTCDANLAALGLKSSPTGYAPDKLWNYELGLNSAFLDKRINLRGSVFYIDWTNIQLNQDLACGFSFITNAGKATSKGAEADLSARLFEGLTMSVGLAYTDSRLDKANPDIPFSHDGDKIPGVSKLTYNFAADYDRKLGIADWKAYVGVDYQHTDGYISQLGPVSALTNRPSVGIGDLHTGMENQVWRFNLFLKNAFDKRAVVGAQAVAMNGQVRETIQAPRTVGLSVTRQF